MIVLGLDLSLNATGWCRWSDDPPTFGTLTPPKAAATGMERLCWVRSQILALAADVDAVVIEGLSFGSNMPSAQERAGLSYLVRFELWSNRQRYLQVAPTAVKKFCTGSGGPKTTKEVVMREVWKRWNLNAGDNNQADAIVLAAVGRAFLSGAVGETKPQSEVLAGLRAKIKDQEGWIAE